MGLGRDDRAGRIPRRRVGGRPDVLLKVEKPSALGSWSYKVADTKLSRETKGCTVLQLSLNTDLVGRVQGHLRAAR
jgi:uncharacterized protein